MSPEPAKVPAPNHPQIESNQPAVFLPALILMAAGTLIAIWASYLI